YKFAEWPDAEAGALAPAFADEVDDETRADAEAKLIAACEAVGRGEGDLATLNDYTSAKPAKPKKQTSGIEFASARIGGEPEDDGEDAYPEKTAAILDAIRNGAWGTAEIRRSSAITVSASHVEQTLPRLIETGEIERIGHGHYHAAGAATCRRSGCGEGLWCSWTISWPQRSATPRPGT